MKKRIYLASPHMGGEELKYINEAFDTNWVAPLGPNVTGFENEICEYIGAKAATATVSGTSAIHLALKCLYCILFNINFFCNCKSNNISRCGASIYRFKLWNMEYMSNSFTKGFLWCREK